MKTGCIACLLVALLTLGSGTALAYHDTLNVVVNGVRQTPDQIREIERLLGGPAMSGRYWFDRTTGFWGFEGGPPLGRLKGGVPQAGNPAGSRGEAPQAGNQPQSNTSGRVAQRLCETFIGEYVSRSRANEIQDEQSRRNVKAWVETRGCFICTPSTRTYAVLAMLPCR